MGDLDHPDCDADHRLTLNNTAYTVANFRQSKPPPVCHSLQTSASPPDGGESHVMILHEVEDADDLVVRVETEVEPAGVVEAAHRVGVRVLLRESGGLSVHG